jgi:hypothetical protein
MVLTGSKAAVDAARLFASGMRQAGIPDEVVALLDELFTVVLDGRNSQVTHGVEEVLGRPARDFSDLCPRHRGDRRLEGLGRRGSHRPKTKNQARLEAGRTALPCFLFDRGP